MVPLARIIEQAAHRHHEADEPALVGRERSLTHREAAERTTLLEPRDHSEKLLEREIRAPYWADPA